MSSPRGRRATSECRRSRYELPQVQRRSLPGGFWQLTRQGDQSAAVTAGRQKAREPGQAGRRRLPGRQPSCGAQQADQLIVRYQAQTCIDSVLSETRKHRIRRQQVQRAARSETGGARGVTRSARCGSRWVNPAGTGPGAAAGPAAAARSFASASSSGLDRSASHASGPSGGPAYGSGHCPYRSAPVGGSSQAGARGPLASVGHGTAARGGGRRPDPSPGRAAAGLRVWNKSAERRLCDSRRSCRSSLTMTWPSALAWRLSFQKARAVRRPSRAAGPLRRWCLCGLTFDPSDRVWSGRQRVTRCLPGRIPRVELGAE